MADLQSGPNAGNHQGNDDFSAPGTVSATVQSEPVPADPDLAKIVAAWPTLSEPIKRAMLALIG